MTKRRCRIARVVALVAGVPLFPAASAAALGLFLNERATAQATALCARLGTGVREDDAVALSRGTGARRARGPNWHEFGFQGWVFNATACRIEIAFGAVMSARAIDYPD